MADEFEKFNRNKGKRRKSYYDFSKNYPGTRYDKNKRSSTSDALDSRRKYRTAFSIVLIVLLFFAVYFVVYTAMEISNTPVAGLENIGVTQPVSEISQIDEETLEEFKINESTDENTTAEEITDSAPEQQ